MTERGGERVGGREGGREGEKVSEGRVIVMPIGGEEVVSTWR
jgi:hypothetical protein